MVTTQPWAFPWVVNYTTYRHDMSISLCLRPSGESFLVFFFWRTKKKKKMLPLSVNHCEWPSGEEEKQNGVG